MAGIQDAVAPAVPRYTCRPIPLRQGMVERRFALVDFTHRSKTGCLRLFRSGAYLFVATRRGPRRDKGGLVAKQRPPRWSPPNIFRPPEALGEVEVIEAVGVVTEATALSFKDISGRWCSEAGRQSAVIGRCIARLISIIFRRRDSFREAAVRLRAITMRYATCFHGAISYLRRSLRRRSIDRQLKNSWVS